MICRNLKFPPYFWLFQFNKLCWHGTSAVKIQTWLYQLLVQYVHIFVLLFILTYIFIYSWHSPYLTVHLAFTTICFMLLPYILLNTIFSSPLPYYPGNTPRFIEYINFSCNFTFFHHIDHISLHFVPFLLRVYLFLLNSSFPAS